MKEKDFEIDFDDNDDNSHTSSTSTTTTTKSTKSTKSTTKRKVSETSRFIIVCLKVLKILIFFFFQFSFKSPSKVVSKKKKIDSSASLSKNHQLLLTIGATFEGKVRYSDDDQYPFMLTIESQRALGDVTAVARWKTIADAETEVLLLLLLHCLIVIVLCDSGAFKLIRVECFQQLKLVLAICKQLITLLLDQNVCLLYLCRRINIFF